MSPGDQTVSQLLGAQSGRDLLLGLNGEAQRQRSEGQLIGQCVGLGLSEVAGDLDAAVGDGTGDIRIEPRGHDGQPVQNDGELGLLRIRGLPVGLTAGGGRRLIAIGDETLRNL